MVSLCLNGDEHVTLHKKHFFLPFLDLDLVEVGIPPPEDATTPSIFFFPPSERSVESNNPFFFFFLAVTPNPAPNPPTLWWPATAAELNECLESTDADALLELLLTDCLLCSVTA